MACARSVPRARAPASGRCSTTATSSSTCSCTRRASTTTWRVCGTTRRGSRWTCRPTRGCPPARPTTPRADRPGMKVIIAAVGRLKEPSLVAAEDEYRKRLRPYCTLTVHEAKDEAALLAALPAGAHLYAFDERGEQLTSAAFAEGVLGHEQQHGGGAAVA